MRTFLSLAKQGWWGRRSPHPIFTIVYFTKVIGFTKRIVLRGANSNNGGNAGPWNLNLNNDAGNAWWNNGADLSLAAVMNRRPLNFIYKTDTLTPWWNLAQPTALVDA